MVNDIAPRLSLVRERISAACLRSGRDEKEILLMGVTKFQPLEAIEEAWKNGIGLFGENRVQEGIEKFASFYEANPGIRTGTAAPAGAPKAELHLIGQLQRNKAKKAAEFFDCIQSADRESLIDELGVLTADWKDPLKIFLEFHTGEDSKTGFMDLDSLFRAAEKTVSFPGLLPLGLMTMAPFTGDKKVIRAAFQSCRRAAEEIKKRFPGKGAWSCLSMGMSGDYEIAVEEGSTLIRIGTAIFGERQ